MRVLLVEDDAATAASIKLMLRKENFICDTTDLGEDGLEIGKLYDYDIIVLDLMLPDTDGYELLRRLRAARVRTPILILSGLAELDYKIGGLGFGADEFLTKPFDRRELVARIQAIVRRSKGHSESVIRTDKLVVNLDTRVVTVDDQPVHLTGKEYGILELLSLRKGAVITKEMFLNHLYGGMDEPELGIVDHFVGKLRKELAQATGGPHYIGTVWGRGHVLSDRPHRAAEQSRKEPWTVRRKAEVVLAVRTGQISLEEVLPRHHLTEEEFRAWERAYEAHGLPGLRTTRVQQYRSIRPSRSRR
jgi:two-component system, cell cycle response regulator CtrA